MHRSIGEFIHDLPAKRPHGQIMDYKSMDTQVAAMVVEHATGKPLDRYLHDRIWEPMGAERDAYWSLDKRNSALAFCCLNATLRDFAKIGLVYLNDGRLNGKQILPAEWVKASHTPDVQIGRSPDNKYVWHFKNYWWIPAYDDGDGDYLSEGVWGQYIYVNPKHNVVIVKVGGGAGPEDYEQESLAMFRSLARSFS